MKAVDKKGISIFLIVAMVGAWLVTVPLWLNEGWRQGIGMMLVGIAMMMTPAIGVLAAFLCADKETNKVELLGLRLGVKSWWQYWLVAWVFIPLVVISSLFVGSALGYYQFDLENFSGLQKLLEQQGAESVLDKMPIKVLVGLQLLSVLIAPVLNAFAAFGEEVGWRGYLLPKLLPLGQVPALLISGVVWGLWHAPIILLGHNYPNNPVAGVFMMVGLCIILGIIFGWLRLASRSLWPAVIAHGALNGSAGVVFLLGDASQTVNPFVVGITGWAGWIIPVVWIAVMFIRGVLPVRVGQGQSA